MFKEQYTNPKYFNNMMKAFEDLATVKTLKNDLLGKSICMKLSKCRYTYPAYLYIKYLKLKENLPKLPFWYAYILASKLGYNNKFLMWYYENFL